MVRSAALALMSLIVAASPACAEQIAVEDAARQAGLAVRTQTTEVNGVAIHYRRIGARGEPVVLLHGFPETGDAFAPVVAALGADHRLIVPDLRGAGASQRPAAGYDKSIVASDVRALLDQLGIEHAHVVGHDIGARVAYAFAVQYPERVASLTVAEAFIEGLPGTAEFKRFAPTNPRTQHFARYAKVDEAMAEHRGKEEALVLSFMNSRSKSRRFVAADVTRYVAALQRDDGLRAAFLGYEAFDRDAAFLERTGAAKLATLPTLAIACAGPAGNPLQRQLAAAGLRNLTGAVLEGCAHWIFEENPAETLAVITSFLESQHARP